MKDVQIAKKLFLTIMMLFCVLALSGCDGDNGGDPPPVAGDCFSISFVDAYYMYSESENSYFVTYFVKGVVLDAVNGYGKKMKLIEDLKGNFPVNVGKTFTVWGNGISFVEDNRVDYMKSYNNQDTLIILLKHSYDWTANDGVPPGHTFYEKKGDYATLSCVPSILKLSNGYFIGSMILPEEEHFSYKQELLANMLDMSKEELDSIYQNVPSDIQVKDYWKYYDSLTKFVMETTGMSEKEYRDFWLDTLSCQELQIRLNLEIKLCE